MVIPKLLPVIRRPLENCWGFIDGIVRPCCRPGINQRNVYNGHKRVHGIKFQSAVTPSGLIANLFSPAEGQKHNSGMLGDSGLCTQLQQYARGQNHSVLCLYGDPAYLLRPQLLGPFKGAGVTQIQLEWNQAMSKVRINVEWIFGDIINYFKFLDFKKGLKLQLSAIGKMYLVCAILQNAHTCLYGNKTSKHFRLQPVNTADYL